MSDPLRCQRCGQKSASIDGALLCGGCRQKNPYLMAAPEQGAQPETIESLHEAACRLTEMLDEAEDRIAALENALKPFAEVFSRHEAFFPLGTEIIAVPMRDLRRAAALLKEDNQ